MFVAPLIKTKKERCHYGHIIFEISPQISAFCRVFMLSVKKIVHLHYSDCLKLMVEVDGKSN
ncbi:hypothetical protein C0J52_13241 [Blattella germanica]|nr:hypothetical protein C0J52_13241 [Blattella germanica]